MIGRVVVGFQPVTANDHRIGARLRTSVMKRPRYQAISASVGT